MNNIETSNDTQVKQSNLTTDLQNLSLHSKVEMNHTTSLMKFSSSNVHYGYIFISLFLVFGSILHLMNFCVTGCNLKHIHNHYTLSEASMIRVHVRNYWLHMVSVCNCDLCWYNASEPLYFTVCY